MNNKFKYRHHNSLLARALFFGLCFGILSDVACQVPYPSYTNFTFEHGLSSQTVHACFQDRDGIMWFATNAGVSRYDGQKFERLSMADGLCDDDVRGIAQDGTGRIWFLTRSNCLSFFIDGKIFNARDYPSLEVDCSNFESALFFESEQIYIGGLGNEVIVISPDLEASTIPKNQAPRESFLWMDLPGLSDNPHVSSLAWCDSIAEESSFDIYINRTAKSGVVSLSSNGIGSYNGENQVIWVVPDKFPDCKDAHRAFFTSGQTAWLTSRTEGVYAFNMSGKSTADPIKLFSGRRILYIMEDRDLNLWFCTESRGVYLIPHSRLDISTYRPADNDQVLSLTHDRRGNIVAGTSTGLVILFSERSLLTQFKIAQIRGSNGISEILVDSINGDLWCAGDFGLLQLQNLGPQWFPLPTSHSTEYVESLVQGAHGNLLIAGNIDIKSLDLQGPGSAPGLFSKTPKSHALFLDDESRLWIQSGSNILVCRDSVCDEVDQFPALSDYKVTSINQTDDGTMIFSTYGGGIHFLKNEEIVHSLTSAHGLLSDKCKAVYVQGSTHYLATDRGVVVYNWDGAKTDILAEYTRADGLPSDDIYDVIVRDSLMYLATSKGLVILNAAHSPPPSSPPVLFWKTLTAGDSILDHHSPIELSHDQAYITINYGGISYDSADQIEYQYRLKDSDSLWVSTSTTSLEFSYLEPGDYKLNLRARKHRSDWSDPIRMELTVLPPYYATWWFRIMILLLISGIAFSVFRFFERRKYERKLAVIMQEQAILEERNRISADMHDDLGSELTNIIILSRIATSQLGLNGDKAVPIQKIDAAATGVISKMNEIIWALNPANDSLEGLANYLQRFVNDFLDLHDLGGRMTRPENLPDIPLKSAFRRNVFLIVKEFMQNINKHAQATRVELHMSVGLTELSIEITDDGVGFDQEKLPGDGNGLRNMIKRAEDVGGTATIKSSPGKGSSINLVVPLRKDHAFA